MDLKELIEQNWELTWDAEPDVGTDKTGKIGHDYINSFYNDELRKYQNEPIRLLEIGVYRGASLALWSKYFPNAEIVGLDIQDLRAEKYKNLDRVTVGICDAYSLEQDTLDDLGNFDIIIDDGPHTLESLEKCIELYLPKLNDGGVMVLEDVQDPEWFRPLTLAIPIQRKSINVECIDIRDHLNRYDDLLFVIRK